MVARIKSHCLVPLFSITVKDSKSDSIRRILCEFYVFSTVVLLKDQFPGPDGIERYRVGEVPVAKLRHASHDEVLFGLKYEQSVRGRQKRRFVPTPSAPTCTAIAWRAPTSLPIVKAVPVHTLDPS